jgi:hypothetical protein
MYGNGVYQDFRGNSILRDSTPRDLYVPGDGNRLAVWPHCGFETPAPYCFDGFFIKTCAATSNNLDAGRTTIRLNNTPSAQQ